MLSADNLQALTQAGYHYIVDSRLQKIPYDISEYQKTGEKLADNQIIIAGADDHRIIYQYRAKRAALVIRNIEKQITKARRIINNLTPTSKAKFLTLKASEKKLNQALIDKAYALVGIKGYVTNLNLPDADIITYYHQLFQVEASFRMAKSDHKARPISHPKQDAIDAHLTIVFAALAIGITIEIQSGISLKQFVKCVNCLSTTSK